MSERNRTYPAHDDPAELHAAAEIVRLSSENKLSPLQIAGVLNAVPELKAAARGGSWRAKTVARVLRRGGRTIASAPKVNAPAQCSAPTTPEAIAAPRALPPATCKRDARATVWLPFSPGGRPPLLFERECGQGVLLVERWASLFEEPDAPVPGFEWL